jgi:tRNA (guanine-N7-)-methyltransferase
MAKHKLAHFAEMKTFSCVFEPENEVMRTPDFYMKGKWNERYFGNDHPITIELGCGKGEYTIALARKYPNRNFIGIDIKGARLWRGSKTVDEEQIPNVAFLRIKVEFINNFFAPGEVDEIWLTFSDPQPKDKKGTKRLTSALFMQRYARTMKPAGQIHVKTDSRFLFDATMAMIASENHQLIEASDDIYERDFHKFSPEQQEILQVKTFYEKKFLNLGQPIHYIRFTLNDSAYQAF